MKGFTAAFIWSLVIIAILAVLAIGGVFDFAINEITTAATGGDLQDNVTALLVRLILIIFVIAVLGAVFLYRSHPSIDTTYREYSG